MWDEPRVIQKRSERTRWLKEETRSGLWKYGNANYRHLRISGVWEFCCFSPCTIVSRVSRSTPAELHGSHSCKDCLLDEDLAVIGLDGACESNQNCSDCESGPHVPPSPVCTPLCGDTTWPFFSWGLGVYVSAPLNPSWPCDWL